MLKAETEADVKQIAAEFLRVDQLAYGTTDRLIAVGVKLTPDLWGPVMVVQLGCAEDAPVRQRPLEFPTRSLVALDAGGQLGAVIPPGDNVIRFFQLWPDLILQPRSVGTPFTRVSAFGIAAGGKVVVAAGTGSPADGGNASDTDFAVIWWRFEANRFESHRTGTAELVTEMAVSDDGRFFATAEANGKNLQLWSSEELWGSRPRPVIIYPNRQLAAGDAYRLRFSPRGTFLASAGLSTNVWHTAAGTYVERFRGQDEDVPDLAFSPDERILALARTDGAVEFWDFRNSRLLRSYSWDIGRLSAIAFAPDGLTCAVAGQGGKIVVWDVEAQ